jgi:hypothetical protein
LELKRREEKRREEKRREEKRVVNKVVVEEVVFVVVFQQQTIFLDQNCPPKFYNSSRLEGNQKNRFFTPHSSHRVLIKKEKLKHGRIYRRNVFVD